MCVCVCVCVCIGLTRSSVREIAPNGSTVAKNEMERFSKDWSWSNGSVAALV